MTSFVLAALAAPIVHHPFQFNVGPLQFTGFGIAVVAAFIVAQHVSQEEMKRLGADPTPIGDLIFAAIACSLIGAKLYFVVVLGNWDSLFARGGFVFWGGLIGGAIGVLTTARVKKLPIWRILEVAAAAVAAGYAVGRTGCWAVGDDYGRPWGGRFAVEFPEGAPASTAAVMTREFGAELPAMDPNTIVSVHPTQLYEVTLALIMFGVLWRLRYHRHREGWLFGVYLVMAGVERFIIEFFRAKDDRLGIGLTTAQTIAIAAFVLGIWMLYTRRGDRVPRVSVAGAQV